MAVAKLGSIITGLAGSIGGTTFRRYGTTLVVQNKVKGASKNKTLKNKALPILASIIQKWSTITVAERNEWNNQATLFLFPDRFGGQKYLTGRQLFIKLNAQASYIQALNIDVFNLNSTVPQIQINSFVFNWAESALVTFSQSYTNLYVLFRFEILSNASVQPTFTKRKVIQTEGTNVATQVQIFEAILVNFYNLPIGTICRVYATPINMYGFVGITTYKETTVIP